MARRVTRQQSRHNQQQQPYRDPTPDFQSSEEEAESDVGSVSESVSSRSSSRGLTKEQKQELYKLLEENGGPDSFTNESRLFGQLVKGNTFFGTATSRVRKQFVNRIGYVRSPHYTTTQYLQELEELGVTPCRQTIEKAQAELVKGTTTPTPKRQAAKKRTTPKRTTPTTTTPSSSASRPSERRIPRQPTATPTSISCQVPRATPTTPVMDTLQERRGRLIESVPMAYQFSTDTSEMPGWPTEYQGLEYFVIPVDVEQAENHLGVCFVDFTENISVRDTNGNTRQVEFVMISLVSPDLDEAMAEYKAFKVSPNQVLLVVPAAPSIFRPIRYGEYVQALQQGGNTNTRSNDELTTRRINMNAMDSPRRRSRLFVLHFPDDLELETTYTQTRMNDPNQIKRLLNPVITVNQVGGGQISTEVAFRLSIVPMEDRIVDRGQVVEVDELAELRQNLLNQARIAQQQQNPPPQPPVQAPAFGAQPMQVPSFQFGVQQHGQNVFGGQQPQQQQPVFNAQPQQQQNVPQQQQQGTAFQPQQPVFQVPVQQQHQNVPQQQQHQNVPQQQQQPANNQGQQGTGVSNQMQATQQPVVVPDRPMSSLQVAALRSSHQQEMTAQAQQPAQQSAEEMEAESHAAKAGGSSTTSDFALAMHQQRQEEKNQALIDALQGPRHAASRLRSLEKKKAQWANNRGRVPAKKQQQSILPGQFAQLPAAVPQVQANHAAAITAPDQQTDHAAASTAGNAELSNQTAANLASNSSTSTSDYEFINNLEQVEKDMQDTIDEFNGMQDT